MWVANRMRCSHVSGSAHPAAGLAVASAAPRKLGAHYAMGPTRDIPNATRTARPQACDSTTGAARPTNENGFRKQYSATASTSPAVPRTTLSSAGPLAAGGGGGGGRGAGGGAGGGGTGGGRGGAGGADSGAPCGAGGTPAIGTSSTLASLSSDDEEDDDDSEEEEDVATGARKTCSGGTSHRLYEDGGLS